jgi:hypothetical protein
MRGSRANMDINILPQNEIEEQLAINDMPSSDEDIS